MIKKWITAIILLGVVAYFATVAYVHFADARRAESLVINATTPDQQIYNLLRAKGCDYCHTTNASLPFYASFPIAKQLMQHDVIAGNRHFDLNTTLDSLRNSQAVPEVDLAKIESVIQKREMPPFRYLFLHWSSRISAEERQQIVSWAQAQRVQYYSTSKAAPQHRTAMIQPLPDAPPVDMAKVKLGSLLYHDTRLSADNSISCSSCHLLDAGGVDGKPVSPGVGGQLGTINAPTVFNAVFNFKQFWDGRANDLQDQARFPPLNPVEMASKSWDEIIAKLSVDPQLTSDFLAVYPQGYSEYTITEAIAEFEKTLVTPNGSLDLYLQGDNHAMTPQQLRGYQLFMDNKCATCHVGKNMGGQSFELMGLKGDYFADRGRPITTDDLGRYNVTKEERDRHRFKVPTLHNIALTAPYFHDAHAKDLTTAVEMMLKYQLGTTLPAQDVKDIVVFLQGLTGNTEFNSQKSESKKNP